MVALHIGGYRPSTHSFSFIRYFKYTTSPEKCKCFPGYFFALVSAEIRKSKHNDIMRIYIAGKITGDKNYKKKFAKAERILKKKGHSVMNPAWLKEYGEFGWIDYMRVSGAMQKTCEAVYFLPGWEESKGANIEHRRAMLTGQKVFFSLGDLP